MDDNVKQASSYQLDQEILDARGIRMTVDEVAGLPTVKYSERVQSLKLNDEDLLFLKGLRRRIKNRLASQNSRRRNMEHLRRLTRELRAVRACREDAITERRSLIMQRTELQNRCRQLREYLAQKLKERSDFTQIPSIDIKRTKLQKPKRNDKFNSADTLDHRLEDKSIFECCIDKLVQKSVNHIYKSEIDKIIDNKRVSAKTVFIPNEVSYDSSDIKFNGIDNISATECVLNLSIKEGRRRSHGRKQSAPRRITYVFDEDDGALDLKIKKESQ